MEAEEVEVEKTGERENGAETNGKKYLYTFGVILCFSYPLSPSPRLAFWAEHATTGGARVFKPPAGLVSNTAGREICCDVYDSGGQALVERPFNRLPFRMFLADYEHRPARSLVAWLPHTDETRASGWAQWSTIKSCCKPEICFKIVSSEVEATTPPGSRDKLMWLQQVQNRHPENYYQAIEDKKSV